MFRREECPPRGRKIANGQQSSFGNGPARWTTRSNNGCLLEFAGKNNLGYDCELRPPRAAFYTRPTTLWSPTCQNVRVSLSQLEQGVSVRQPTSEAAVP